MYSSRLYQILVDSKHHLCGLRCAHCLDQYLLALAKGNSETIGNMAFTKGIVTDLNIKDGEARIIVGNKTYTLDQVTSVSAEAPETEEQTTTE